jgi:hypothetical protein
LRSKTAAPFPLLYGGEPAKAAARFRIFAYKQLVIPQHAAGDSNAEIMAGGIDSEEAAIGDPRGAGTKLSLEGQTGFN